MTLSWSEGWLPVSSQAGGWRRGATQRCSGQLQTTVELRTRHRTPAQHSTSSPHITGFFSKCRFCEGYADKKLSQRRSTGGVTSLCCCHSVCWSSGPSTTLQPTQHWICVSVASHSWLNYEWRYKYPLTDNMSSSTIPGLLFTHHTVDVWLIIKYQSHTKWYLTQEALPGVRHWHRTCLSYHLRVTEWQQIIFGG